MMSEESINGKRPSLRGPEVLRVTSEGGSRSNLEPDLTTPQSEEPLSGKSFLGAGSPASGRRRSVRSVATSNEPYANDV